jgi:dTDP-glucose 4,6-dehydratase
MNLQNKKVLVTGAGGFIGSHLVEALVKKGAKVKAFVRYNSKNNWGWLEQSAYKDKIEIYTGDIRDFDSTKTALQECEVVFHLAALIGIPYSYLSPLAYIKTNIEGTYNVLQAAKENNLERVVITSTSEVYGTAQYTPIDEQHVLQPQSPYSSSKIAADNLALSYYYSFGLPVTIVRPFNVYGPRQSARAVIPTIITQLLNGKLVKLGSLDTTRDYTYVTDTAQGFIKIAEANSLIGEETNIGQNLSFSIKQIYDYCQSILGTSAEIETDEQRIRPEKSEVQRLLCENIKLLKHTDWQPEFSGLSGLIKTIEWFKENESLYKSNIYNV